VVPARLLAVLERLDAHFRAVAAGFDWSAPEASLPRLGEALAEARELLSERSPSGFFDVRHELERKEEQLLAAIRAAAGVSFDALASEPAAAAAIIQALGDNALSVLNPVMAACKAMADAAHGVEGRTLVTTMARNGTEFGIRVSGLGERWFTAPCPQPVGLYFPGFSAEDGNPDIGDSTITETAGLGAFAMAAAPAIVTFVSGTPQDALNATLEMYEITAAEHASFTIPQLDFRGTPVGIDLRAVVETGITPRVNTGIAHREAGVGQIGAGLVRPPLELFTEALIAFADDDGL